MISYKRRRQARAETLDAKIIVAIDDMDRDEITGAMLEAGAVFHHTERTSILREYLRNEYMGGRVKAETILANYQGAL